MAPPDPSQSWPSQPQPAMVQQCGMAQHSPFVEHPLMLPVRACLRGRACMCVRCVLPSEQDSLKGRPVAFGPRHTCTSLLQEHSISCCVATCCPVPHSRRGRRHAGTRTRASMEGTFSKPGALCGALWIRFSLLPIARGWGNGRGMFCRDRTCSCNFPNLSLHDRFVLLFVDRRANLRR